MWEIFQQHDLIWLWLSPDWWQQGAGGRLYAAGCPGENIRRRLVRSAPQPHLKLHLQQRRAAGCGISLTLLHSSRYPQIKLCKLFLCLLPRNTFEFPLLTRLTIEFTGTSQLLSQRLHPPGSEANTTVRHSVQRVSVEMSTIELQRSQVLEQQQQMKILEWENRMRVLAWEQELVKVKRRAARQEEKAFRMKKAYYKAKLKRMGEDVPPSSSSSSDEAEKGADPTGWTDDCSCLCHCVFSWLVTEQFSFLYSFLCECRENILAALKLAVFTKREHKTEQITVTYGNIYLIINTTIINSSYSFV